MTAMIFFDLRRVGRVAQTLVTGSVAGVESRHRRRRSTSTGTIEQKLGHDPSSGSWNEPDYRRQSTSAAGSARPRAIASDTEQRSSRIAECYRACLTPAAERVWSRGGEGSAAARRSCD
jgi:hypothetical protein